MYKVAIIGAGVAGIAAAKHARRLGLDVILIEKDKSFLGGTCLNRGCIPAKFLLRASQLNKQWKEISARKDTAIEAIKASLMHSLKANGVKIQWGEASFLDEHTLKVGACSIEAENIIIACGSSPKRIVEHKKAIFAEELFSQLSLGEKFLIIGGGGTGIELASLLNNLGKDVSVAEKEQMILPSFDSRIARRLKMILEKRGIKIYPNQNVRDIDCEGFDTIILSAGRSPASSKLNLEKAGINRDEGGWICTDKFMRTNIGNIYACGDISGKKLLAYVAEYQGELCVNNIAGRQEAGEYSVIPESVFSIPQIAQVGVLEEEAEKRNLKYKIIKSNFLRFSSSYVYNDKDAFMKIIVDDNDRLMGATIISKLAAELINILSLCIRSNLTLQDLKKNIFIHPTISEIIPLFLKS